MSWKCDVACRHCVFHSSPKKTGQIDVGQALSAVSELASISSIKRVTVSGGEAFLNVDALKLVGERVRKLGLAFRIVTNASFATSERHAADIISSVQEYNLEALCI